MKVKKSIKILLVCFLAIICFSFAACFSPKSAYDIAVENGFNGTEAEWLNSLKGEDASDVSIYDIYEAYLEDNPGVSFNDFIAQYLTINTLTTEEAAVTSLRSAVSVWCQFAGLSGYSAGSGVIYKLEPSSNTAYIITNYHVIYDSTTNSKHATSINVYLYGAEYNNSSIKAEFIGGSILNDIAVLKAVSEDFFSETVKAAEIADSNLVTVGESIIAAGNSNGEGLSVVSGIVSVESEYIEMEKIDNPNDIRSPRVIRIDAPVNGGNSGGGLYNLNGQLLGIVNAKSVDESIEGMCYAIPSRLAIAIANNILDGVGKKCLLGLTTEIISSKGIYNSALNRIEIFETLKVTSISNNSLAYNKFQVGDILKTVSVNGGDKIELSRNFYLSELLFTVRDSDVLSFEVIRNGTTSKFDITVMASLMSDL